jgi:homocysteine S-methyltransferase
MEMMMDLEQTGCAVEAAVSTGVPVWIGFSCRVAEDDVTVLMFTEPEGGLSFEDVLDQILPLGGSVAGVMHSEIDDIAPALKVLFEHWSGPVAAYAESGDFVMPNWQFVDVISPQDYVAKAQTWVEMGTQIVGGCCGIGPEHIKLLKRRLPTHLPVAKHK